MQTLKWHRNVRRGSCILPRCVLRKQWRFRLFAQCILFARPHEHVACDGIANIDIRANDLLHAVRKAQHAGIYRKRCVENFGKLLGNVVAACDGRVGHHADFLIRRVHFLCGDGVKVAAFSAPHTEATSSRSEPVKMMLRMSFFGISTRFKMMSRYSSTVG